MKSESKVFAGILGGGQLAWLLNLSAQKFGIRTRVWDTSPGASGFQGATQIHCSSWDSEKGVDVFCRDLDFCTLEWESIPISLLEKIEAKGKLLMPSSKSVKQSSSRILERKLFASLGFDLAPWMAVDSADDLNESSWAEFWKDAKFTKVFLKHDRGGYDGKGQIRLDANAPLSAAQDFFSLGDSRGIIEAHADLDYEVSVVAARNRSGDISVLGCFENQHENGVLRVTRLLSLDRKFDQSKAIAMMTALLNATDYVGTAALELFVEKSGIILANEWAPRVHNSGHLSLDTFEESQFDLHWRALCDLKFLPNPVKRKGLMVNVLAEDLTGEVSFTRKAILENTDPMPFLARHLTRVELKSVRSVVPYDYAKKELKPGRKMGHLNVLLA